MAAVAYPRNDFPAGIPDLVAHRPWPLPEAPWLMTQTWHDLLFAHWPVDDEPLAALVPPEFELDLFDGQAWVGVVPFYMTNVAPRAVPALPWVSHFPELNVRTYVRAQGKPGVYFFSLDADFSPAVLAARAVLSLPYFRAAMSVERDGEWLHYRSTRAGSDVDAAFEARYRPAGPVFEAPSGTLDYFLTERYCLYARHHSGSPYRLEIHHPPWRLQRGEAEITRNSMVAAAGLPTPEFPPLLHYSRRQDMLAWAPRAID